MLNLLTFLLLPVMTLATSNYCQWAAIVTNGIFSYGDYGGYINDLYLFDSSACSGETCVIPQGSGASIDSLDQRPTSGMPYVCDGTVQFASYLLGLPGIQTHYICTVSLSRTSGHLIS
jgi:hypothetical protein